MSPHQNSQLSQLQSPSSKTLGLLPTLSSLLLPMKVPFTSVIKKKSNVWLQNTTFIEDKVVCDEEEDTNKYPMEIILAYDHKNEVIIWQCVFGDSKILLCSQFRSALATDV